MGCADVCLDMDYDGNNEFHFEKRVTARKTHTCCECREPITTGTKYTRVSGKSEGHLWTNATCDVCKEIREQFVCGSWIYGELWQTIEEAMFPRWNEVGPYDCLAKLESEAAVKMANARYAEWKNEQT